MSNIAHAKFFAKAAHTGQLRNYTGEPYVTHTRRVADRVAAHPGSTDTMVMIAHLHDTLEDCDVDEFAMLVVFGEEVLLGVKALSNPKSNAPRAERKAADRRRLSQLPNHLKVIKLIDRIDNVSDMDKAPSKFRALYFEESRLLLEALRGADEGLEAELEGILDV